MIISVKVITRARQEKVEILPDGSFKVWARSAPERGRANERVVELLAEYFHKPIGSFSIITGQAVSRKLVEIV